MKTECSIVMDLLPLYVEELVSEQTAEYVSRHLGECPNCQAEFNIMKGGAKIEISESVPAPKVDNIPPFKKVMKRMNRVFYSLSYSLIIFFIFLGFGWTAGENLMYNSLIMPIVGIFGYCAFGYRSVYKIPALLLIIDLFVCVFKSASACLGVLIHIVVLNHAEIPVISINHFAVSVGITVV